MLWVVHLLEGSKENKSFSRNVSFASACYQHRPRIRPATSAEWSQQKINEVIIRVKAAAAAEAEERGDKESRGGGQRQTICGGEGGGGEMGLFLASPLFPSSSWQLWRWSDATKLDVGADDAVQVQMTRLNRSSVQTKEEKKTHFCPFLIRAVISIIS